MSNDTTSDNRRQRPSGSKSPNRPPDITSDVDFFAPAPHTLIADRRVNASAFRLWCVLKMLEWRREPATMERLQDEMSSNDPASHAKGTLRTRPATRRSIELWLTELEEAGWLEWHRNKGVTERYHLKSRRASDGEVSTSTTNLHSQSADDANGDSQTTNLDSQTTNPDSHAPLFHGIAKRQKRTLKKKNLYKRESTPPDHGGGDSLQIATLLREHGVGAVESLALLFHTAGVTLADVQADIARRQSLGQPIGVMVNEWRQHPPVGAAAAHKADRPIDIERYFAGEYAGLFRRGDDLEGLALDNEAEVGTS